MNITQRLSAFNKALSDLCMIEKESNELMGKVVEKDLPIGTYSKLSTFKIHDSNIMGVTYRFSVIYPLANSPLVNHTADSFVIVSLPNVSRRIIDLDHSYVVSSMSKHDLIERIQYFILKGVDSQTINIAYMLSRLYSISLGDKISLSDFVKFGKMCDVTNMNLKYIKSAIVNGRIPFLHFIAYPPANEHMPIIERIVYPDRSLLEIDE